MTKSPNIAKSSPMPASKGLISARMILGGPTMRLVALAITGNERIADFPNVPTTAEAGLPSFKLATWPRLLAPAGTPPDITAKLNKEIVSILDKPAVKEKWAVFGAVVASASKKTSRTFDSVS